MRRETACFSMYSVMSMRIMASSVSKRVAARVLASSVFPTPVGPRKRKLPMGRFGSFRPALARRMASATALMASSCPTTRLWSSSSSLKSFSLSPSRSLDTGIPVQRETISAMSSSVTRRRTKRAPRSFSERASTSASSLGSSP